MPMINEDFHAVVQNNDRGTYLGSNKQKVNGNNITAERKQQAEATAPRYKDGAITE
jgi:hypothetical protein